MRAKRKKQPGDYPQMIFRISQEDKDKLHDLIDRIASLANKKTGMSGFQKIRKNDVIVTALFFGLQSLEKKLTKQLKPKR